MRRRRHNLRTGALAAVLLLPLGLAGCGDDEDLDGPDPPAPAGPIVDLRVDTNRNGTVDLDDPTEDENEDLWDANQGAIFMANIDDDLDACPADSGLTDEQLAGCFDGADEWVNGPDDLVDMARIMTVPWPKAPDDATATLELSVPALDHVRLFINNGVEFVLFPPGTVLTAEQLRQGVELAIEGKDVVRDLAVWDGLLWVTLHVLGGSHGELFDTVMMRIAPLLTTHHLQEGERVYISAGGSDYQVYEADMLAALETAGVPMGLEALQAGFDVWTQDFFETAYMTMPVPGGMHVIDVFMRSASNWGASEGQLRPSGKLVYTHFQGPDAAGLTEYGGTGTGNGLNDGGNFETIPPFEHNGESWPLGRIVRGSTPSFHPSENVDRMMNAQLQQPIVEVDTSWLAVGHIDETLTYMKADSPRGWIMAANDPAMAIDMLQTAADQGHGSVVMFEGQYWDTNVPADITIQEVLDDVDLMADNAQAIIDVADQVNTLKEATGITDAEIIPIPFLHEESWGASVAYQPGTVNGIVINTTHYGPPAPHGPVIDGEDIFLKQLDDVMAPYGITVHPIEEWGRLHIGAGEVHCGSNTLRAVPQDVFWWETGR
jgi:protein-arginine deiminase